MPDGDKPTLYLIAGPNGAGKSSLYAWRIAKITNAPFMLAATETRAYSANKDKKVINSRERAWHSGDGSQLV